MTHIERNLILKAIDLFRDQREFCAGYKIGYEGFEYLEDETIIGNSDKINFYIKDFLIHLEKTPKQNLNPFYIAKLDIDSIQHFEFPQVPANEHPFLREVPYLQENFNAQLKQAQQREKFGIHSNFSKFQSQIVEYQKRIKIPSMLTLYCNSIEVMRLRQELVLAITET